MRVVFLSCVSVTIELENKEVYYSLKAFDVYLNDKKVLSNYKKNVFSLFDLTPDTDYVVSVDDETISFRSEKVSEVIDVYPIEGDATKHIQEAIDKANKGSLIVIHDGLYPVNNFFTLQF